MRDKNFSIATREDDFQLRECLRLTPMSGKISVAFEAEPSYFDALSVQGKTCQVVVCKDERGQLMGFGTIAKKPVFLNGDIVEVGYLSGLRSYPQFRKGTFLARAYRFLREVDIVKHVPFCMTTIIEDNHTVRTLLESRRAGLPNYNFFGTLSSFLIKPRKKIKRSDGYINIVSGNLVSLEDIVKFMNHEGSKKQFYPYIEVQDFGTDYLRGLRQEDLYVALDGKEVIGVIAKWDQEPFKQTRVVGYRRGIRLAKPFINLASRFTNVSRFPSEGESVHYFYSSFPTVRDNDPKIMESMLSKLITDPKNQGYDYFCIGIMDSDDLSRSVRAFNPLEYRSRLYLVSFDNKTLDDFKFLNERTPYLELGSL